MRMRSSSMMDFDGSAPLLEHANENVAAWSLSSSSPEVRRMLSKDLRDPELHTRAREVHRSRVPLSPTCYRICRKQMQVTARPLSLPATPLITKKAKPNRTIPRQYPLASMGRERTRISDSRKAETSGDDSGGRDRTVDSYSNSVFLEDDDPTIIDCDHSSGFTDEDLSEGIPPHLGDGGSPIPYPVYPPMLISSQSLHGRGLANKKGNSPTGEKETRTENPLFRSARAQFFLENHKQAWQVPNPEEAIVRHTNPLFQNKLIHELIHTHHVPWEVPDESPKRRSFFKKPSITDLSAFRKTERVQASTPPIRAKPSINPL